MKLTDIKTPKYITNINHIEGDPYSYIITREELQYMLNGISNELKHPVTVMNLNYPVKKDDKEQNSNAIFLKSIRIDSVSSFYALRNTCRNLRVAAGEKYCMECDYYHAKYCQNIFAKGLVKNNRLDFFSEKYTEPTVCTASNNREYIIYDCPMLGYCEICFPIFINNKIIGVFFVGEILLEYKKKRIQEVRNGFLDKNKHIFNDYCNNWGKKEKNIRERVINLISTEWSNEEILLKDNNNNSRSLDVVNFQESISRDVFEKLIDECALNVVDLENRLKDLWKHKQSLYFKNIIQEINRNFNEEYKEIKSYKTITYNDIQNLFEILYKCVAKIRIDFKFDYCRVFENLPIMQGTEFEMDIEELIGFCPYIDLKFDFSKIDLNLSSYKSSLKEKNNNLINCFTCKTIDNITNRINDTTDIIIACENLVVVFGIESICRKKEEKYYKPNYTDILFEEIGKSFLNMCNAFENISAVFMQQQYHRTLRMYRHECAHLAKRIQQDNLYYSNRKIYELLSNEKKNNIYKDINSISQLLQHLSTNIGLIVGSVNNESLINDYSLINIRNEINKWRAMYRLELAKKNIRLYNATDKEYEGQSVFSHEELLCLLLYNLIDNAIKYSYWGTNINAEIINDGLGSKIIVEDYGMEIENNNHPYDLFYREKNASKKRIGDGIGLYSAKRVATILGLNLYHSCEKISDFNIPLVNEAKTRKLVFDNMEEAYKEFENLNDDVLYKILIDEEYYANKKYSRLSNERILNEIYRPTYHVVFTVDSFNITIMKK